MSRRTVGRRAAIQRTLAWWVGAGLGGSLLTGCDPEPPPPCEPSSDDPAIGWGPNVLQPVFYGYADYNPSVGAPANLRVYYPSLDGSPPCAPFLGGPGHFPLVLFLHGQCNHNGTPATENFHYTKWSRLPAVLARSGFIVAMPDLGGIGDPWNLTSPTYTLINDVLGWMRSTWSHRSFLMSPPTLGIVGHSYGALHGGQVALTTQATAYMSLGGPWTEWLGLSSPPAPLPSLTMPKMLVWGTTEFLSSLPDANWNALSGPKHRLVFTDGDHWDYVPPSVTVCDRAAGPCGLVDDLAADFAAMFLSRYMSPEEAPLPRFAIDPDLRRPTNIVLTQEQMFFAGGHLTSFDQVASSPGCSAALTWSTPDGSGSRSLP
jgi:hypothetical protein